MKERGMSTGPMLRQGCPRQTAAARRQERGTVARCLKAGILGSPWRRRSCPCVSGPPEKAVPARNLSGEMPVYANTIYGSAKKPCPPEESIYG